MFAVLAGSTGCPHDPPSSIGSDLKPRIVVLTDISPITDATATRLANWDADERDEPSLFAGMFSPWLVRRDEAAGPDPRWLFDNYGEEER